LVLVDKLLPVFFFFVFFSLFSFKICVGHLESVILIKVIIVLPWLS
jgi:hypothetical protein